MDKDNDNDADQLKRVDRIIIAHSKQAQVFLKKHAALLEQFKVEVHDRAKYVDPDSEEDWHSLTLGWAIAKGLKPRTAREFATTVRYNTDLA